MPSSRRMEILKLEITPCNMIWSSSMGQIQICWLDFLTVLTYKYNFMMKFLIVYSPSPYDAIICVILGFTSYECACQHTTKCSITLYYDV